MQSTRHHSSTICCRGTGGRRSTQSAKQPDITAPAALTGCLQLGHAKLDTTARYAHVATSTLRTKAYSLATMRELLGVAEPEPIEEANGEANAVDAASPRPCPCCGGQMRIIET
ncbi:MAG: hypothetical protein KJ587_17630, partial [Alphaproteobacteria bacterium]|nr:hypothetical protein [Alphaproteobacteria bacterium]